MPLLDLHLHSTMSDGTMTPREIMTLARQRGVATLSITDHDTVAAYPEALDLGRQAGVAVICGLEVTAHHRGLSLHLLGFGLDHQSPALAAGLSGIQEARRARNLAIIARLNGLNIPLTLDDLPNHRGQTGRPHIARALQVRGVVRSEQEAFARFLRKDGAAYVQRQLLPIAQAIAMIVEAGGLPVLAHPGALRLGEPGLRQLVRELIDQGLAGLEVYHPMNSAPLTRSLAFLCQALGLVATGGSDFHGREGDKAPLGEAGGKLPVPVDLLAPLLARLNLNPPPVCRLETDKEQRHAQHPDR